MTPYSPPTPGRAGRSATPTELRLQRLERPAPPLTRRPRPLMRLQSAALGAAGSGAVAVTKAALCAGAPARLAARPSAPPAVATPALPGSARSPGPGGRGMGQGRGVRRLPAEPRPVLASS